MAKQAVKRTELPTVDEEAIEQQEIAGEQLADKAEAAATVAAGAQVGRRQLDVPLAVVEFSYLPRRIDLRKLTKRQSGALRQLQEALSGEGVRLADGSQIKNPANAIKWLLESLAGA